MSHSTGRRDSTLICWVANAERHVAAHSRNYTALLALATAFLAVQLVLGNNKMGDFLPLLRAADRVLAGNDLYVHHQEASFVYPPPAVLMGLALSWLPLPAAKLVWFGAMLICWIASCRLALQLSASSSQPVADGVRLAAFLAPTYFAVSAFRHGQVTPLMLFLVLLSLRSTQQGRAAIAGIALGAALLIKPYPVLFAVLFLLQREWRSVFATITTMSFGLGASHLLLRHSQPELWRDWLEVNALQQGKYPTLEPTVQSVWGFWNRVFGVAAPEPLLSSLLDPVAVATISSSLVLLFLSFLPVLSKPYRCANGPTVSAALLMICWAALPPLGWKHYYLVLLLPSVLVARAAFEQGSVTARRVLAVVVVATLTLQFAPGSVEDVLLASSAVLLCGLALSAALLKATFDRVYRAGPRAHPVLADDGRRGPSDLTRSPS